MNYFPLKSSQSHQTLPTQLLHKQPYPENTTVTHSQHLSTIPITYKTVIEERVTNITQTQGQQFTPLTFNLHSPYKAKLKKNVRPISRTGQTEESKKKGESFTLCFDNYSKTSSKVETYEADNSRNRSLKTSKFQSGVIMEKNYDVKKVSISSDFRKTDFVRKNSNV